MNIFIMKNFIIHDLYITSKIFSSNLLFVYNKQIFSTMIRRDEDNSHETHKQVHLFSFCPVYSLMGISVTTRVVFIVSGAEYDKCSH